MAAAVLLPPETLFAALFLAAPVGIGLLHLTPGFRWGRLARGAGRIGWRAVAIFAALTLAVAMTVMALTAPGKAFALPWTNPGLLAAVLVLSPPLSALPQKVLYRPLFFRRYGVLLPGLWSAIVLNAGLFLLRI
ncbi:hypothetical protein [Rhodovulum imhoffii]|uniref:hypothetical protein n=1 Tax=Rhodovulum imhoffii TaxID=365340 RepID=UPI000D38064C|nr:hypothetical protein [Rhodovulum imhoffii]MBK5933810.1 hypothetical protein [Rhodovulum imhoffii]